MEIVISEALKLTDDIDRENRKHKGLFYRANSSFYYSQSSGVFHKRTTLTPLKRKSCKGCQTCEAVHETISEYSEEMEGFLENVVHGKMYELKVDGGKTWTDCGYEYDSWLELNEIEEDMS